jgi:hypothetical protein
VISFVPLSVTAREHRSPHECDFRDRETHRVSAAPMCRGRAAGAPRPTCALRTRLDGGVAEERRPDLRVPLFRTAPRARHTRRRVADPPSSGSTWWERRRVADPPPLDLARRRNVGPGFGGAVRDAVRHLGRGLSRCVRPASPAEGASVRRSLSKIPAFLRSPATYGQRPGGDLDELVLYADAARLAVPCCHDRGRVTKRRPWRRRYAPGLTP